MYQHFIVYILIILAIGGAIRFIYRKLRTFKKENCDSVCQTCPLKKNCSKLKRSDPDKNDCCSDQ